MTKQLLMVCEAKLAIEAQGGKEPTGKIEARVTTWGPREGADGRRFFYQPEGFMDWAKEFSESGRPLPMFVNHDADAIPVEFQRVGCDAHVLHPDLVPYQRKDSPDENHAVYVIDGVDVINGENGYKSSEIVANPQACISGDTFIADLRNKFDGKIVG